MFGRTLYIGIVWPALGVVRGEIQRGFTFVSARHPRDKSWSRSPFMLIYQPQGFPANQVV